MYAMRCDMLSKYLCRMPLPARGKAVRASDDLNASSKDPHPGTFH